MTTIHRRISGVVSYIEGRLMLEIAIEGCAENRVSTLVSWSDALARDVAAVTDATAETICRLIMNRTATRAAP